MKRLIFALLILMLVISVFTMNSMLVFAEGDSTDSAASETTLPKGEIKGLVGELRANLGEVKDEFVGLFKSLMNFIKSNDTYTNVFTAIAAILAIIFVPFIVAILVLVYIAVAVIVLISSVLTSLAEAIVGWVIGAALIV